MREALSIGHDYVGTEHLLLGLVRENGGVAAWILFDRGAAPRRVAGLLVERARMAGREEYVASFAAGGPEGSVPGDAHAVDVSHGPRRDGAGGLGGSARTLWIGSFAAPLALAMLLAGLGVGLLAGWLIWR